MADPAPEAARIRPGAETSRDRGQWSSEPAFVFSMAAAAVGLGNLWPLPYPAGEYGGGFILAYLVAMAVVCLPLMYLEVAAGRLAQGNTVHTFRQVHRTGAWYGWFVVGLTTVITSYYLVVTGWTMGYAVDALRDDVRPFAEFPGDRPGLPRHLRQLHPGQGPPASGLPDTWIGLTVVW